jgi:hypothetical protein
MLRRERGVKGLDAESARVSLEALGAHERDGAQPADVAVVQVPAVVEGEAQGGVGSFVGRKGPAAEQQGPREPRLDDDAIARTEIEDDELRPALAAKHLDASEATHKVLRRDFSQDVRLRDIHPHYAASTDLAVEVAGDRLRLRQLRQ